MYEGRRTHQYLHLALQICLHIILQHSLELVEAVSHSAILREVGCVLEHTVVVVVCCERKWCLKEKTRGWWMGGGEGGGRGREGVVGGGEGEVVGEEGREEEGRKDLLLTCSAFRSPRLR